MVHDPARQYREQQILNATPAQQVVMMYDTAIASCLKAKAAIGRKDIQARHNANARAMEVVNYLLEILDLEKGGDVAKRLYVIYAQLLRKLMDVDLKNDPQVCDEVVEHLRILRQSWAQLADKGVTDAVATAGTRVDAPEQGKVLRAEPAREDEQGKVAGPRSAVA